MKTIKLASGIKFNVEESTDYDFLIGQELTITGHSVKQKGYGRQGLYLIFAEIDGEHYYGDVYPNIEEHFHLEVDEFRSTSSMLEEALDGETITIYLEAEDEE